MKVSPQWILAAPTLLIHGIINWFSYIRALAAGSTPTSLPTALSNRYGCTISKIVFGSVRMLIPVSCRMFSKSANNSF